MYSRFDNTFNQFLLRLHFGERLMLVTFTKNNHANITMFGVNAVHTENDESQLNREGCDQG
jgi:hypothetical protein